MKLSVALTLSLLISVLSTPVPPSIGSTIAPRQGRSFAKADGTKFNVDGKTAYLTGSNAYWLGFQSTADIDTVLNHVKASGLNILRVWGFNDVSATPAAGTVWFQSFVKGQDPVINMDEDGLQRLKYVVDAASSRGLKLIIPFVNSWDDYGGIKAYTNFYGITREAWFTDEKAQKQYYAYIDAVVGMFKNSDAIFAW